MQLWIGYVKFRKMKFRITLPANPEFSVMTFFSLSHDANRQVQILQFSYEVPKKFHICSIATIAETKLRKKEPKTPSIASANFPAFFELLNHQIYNS